MWQSPPGILARELSGSTTTFPTRRPGSGLVDVKILCGNGTERRGIWKGREGSKLQGGVIVVGCSGATQGGVELVRCKTSGVVSDASSSQNQET